MAETATTTKQKDTKAGKAYEPTVEERLDRIERSIGIHGPEEVPVDAVAGEPLKPHQLYAPGDEEESE